MHPNDERKELRTLWNEIVWNYLRKTPFAESIICVLVYNDDAETEVVLKFIKNPLVGVSPRPAPGKGNPYKSSLALTEEAFEKYFYPILPEGVPKRPNAVDMFLLRSPEEQAENDSFRWTTMTPDEFRKMHKRALLMSL